MDSVAIRIVIFALGTVGLLYLSRRSLAHPSSHGFPRFFAFEAVLALILLNLPSWFVRPGSLLQILSWGLLSVSLALVVWGVILLHRLGGSGSREEESPHFAWERTESLVTSGIYRFIRHPMYASLFYLAWGAFLKDVSAPAAVLAVLATVALTLTARVEEGENLERFGEEYREYMTRTRRFVPMIF